MLNFSELINPSIFIFRITGAVEDIFFRTPSALETIVGAYWLSISILSSLVVKSHIRVNIRGIIPKAMPNIANSVTRKERSAELKIDFCITPFYRTDVLLARKKLLFLLQPF